MTVQPMNTARRRPGNAGDEYQIHLNFIPIAGPLPDFTIYRRAQTAPDEERPAPSILGYALPNTVNDTDNWSRYWVSIDKAAGYEPFQVSASTQRWLTCRILFHALADTTKKVLAQGQFELPKKRFIEEVVFIDKEYDEGHETLVVQPYYLRATRQFGYLVDFHFRLREGKPFDRRVQQLSLSLDSRFRRNVDYYVDRTRRVATMMHARQDVFNSLKLPDGQPLPLHADSVALPADRLKTKLYVFASNKESKSQFTGLRDHGPLSPLPVNPRLLFMFREKDRHAARFLARHLQGSTSQGRFAFPGFKALFKCDLEFDANPVILSDLSQGSLEDALERAQRDRQNFPIIVPVLVLPEDDDSYLVQKSLFSHAEIATQVCTLRILKDEDSLKWAIANLALQIFCKAGGVPWKVRPTGDRSLIIGISQSHKLKVVDGQRTVEKYFAFSVMTDNSGLFQQIQVLGEDATQGGYIEQVRRNLAELLRVNTSEFARIVVHTSFKLKHEEIDAIQETVAAAAKSEESKCRFAVVKVNQKNRFFGTNRDANSLVPYEATRAKLGPREYLVWFEGIFPDRTTVNKVFPGPTHLQILRIGDEQAVSDEVLLQDLVNLSGANWRGFNAKSTPVSVFYCHLVADLVHDFHERNLPLPAVKDIKPWFL
ncbi:MAG TPA: Piwi domain-containing protein [Phycisphaerales bacterium]|nr:Piwi domain-containing protein [Phycisphaerales bacterium]